MRTRMSLWRNENFQLNNLSKSLHLLYHLLMMYDFKNFYIDTDVETIIGILTLGSNVVHIWGGEEPSTSSASVS